MGAHQRQSCRFPKSITAATQEVLATTAANFQAAEARQLQAEEPQQGDVGHSAMVGIPELKCYKYVETSEEQKLFGYCIAIIFITLPVVTPHSEVQSLNVRGLKPQQCEEMVRQLKQRCQSLEAQLSKRRAWSGRGSYY